VSDPQQPPHAQQPEAGWPQPGQPQYGQPQYGQPQYGQPQQQPYPPSPAGPGQPYPQPMNPQDERTWGMLSHLASIAASFVGLPFLGPLIVFLVLKDRSRFVRGHAAESLNMNISLIAYTFVLSIVFGIIALLTFGIGLALFVPLSLLPIAALVFTILAAVAAYGGRPYRYPLIFRLVH